MWCNTQNAWYGHLQCGAGPRNSITGLEVQLYHLLPLSTPERQYGHAVIVPVRTLRDGDGHSPSRSRTPPQHAAHHVEHLRCRSPPRGVDQGGFGGGRHPSNLARSCTPSPLTLSQLVCATGLVGVGGQIFAKATGRRSPMAPGRSGVGGGTYE